MFYLSLCFVFDAGFFADVVDELLAAGFAATGFLSATGFTVDFAAVVVFATTGFSFGICCCFFSRTW